MVGKFGNTLDAKASKDIVADSDEGDTDSDSDAEAGQSGPRRGLLSQKKREEADICFSYSVTEPTCMRTMDRRYGYIPISNTKPCVYTICMFEDFRKRHFHSNILNRIMDDLVTIAYDFCLASAINFAIYLTSVFLVFAFSSCHFTMFTHFTAIYSSTRG